MKCTRRVTMMVSAERRGRVVVDLMCVSGDVADEFARRRGIKVVGRQL
jgi:hypothetical protein